MRRQPVVYLPATQATSRNEEILAYVADPAVAGPLVRRVLTGIDPDQSIGRVRLLSDQLGANDRATLWLGVVFATIAAGALVLASIGLFGVIGYSVTRRTREIGVRMALGADAATLRRGVMGQALRLTSIGLVIGIITALGLVRFTGSFLAGGAPQFSMVYLAVAVVFLAVGVVASIVPARRATRVDPLIALRAQ
jgi:putative ABC transport system permease protein